MKKITILILSTCLTNNLFADILTVKNTDDSGAGSLRRLIEIANVGDTIIFDKSLYGKTIEVRSVIYFNSKILTINGENINITLSGGNQNGIFDGVKFCNNLTFINSLHAITTSGTLKIKNCVFKNNKTAKNDQIYNAGFGSAVSGTSSSANIIIDSCRFENNISDIGGAIHCSNDINVSHSIFINNNAQYGGAIACGNQNSNFTGTNSDISDCIFQENTASSGGSICIFDRGSLTSTRNRFENNTAVMGGAIRIIKSFDSHYYNFLTITGSTFTNNIATSNGGAISFEGYKFNIYESLFENNSSGNNGGACSLTTRYGYINNSSFICNSSITNGGALSIDSGSTEELINNTFEKNKASNTGLGGAISILGYSADIIHCTFSSNSAYLGGAISGNGCGLKGNIFENNKIMPDDVYNDVNGTFESNGYNVYTSNQNTIFSGKADYKYTGEVSLLDKIGEYGGNIPTMKINTNIPNWETIVIRVPNESTGTLLGRYTDQRGFKLPNVNLLCAGSVEMKYETTKINDVQKEKIVIYPNPTKDIINFNLENSTDIQILDMSGKIIKKISGKIGKNEINISNFIPGVLFLIIKWDVYKIIKI